MTCAENAFTNAVDVDDVYRAPAASEARAFEVTNFDLSAGSVRFSFDELLAAIPAAAAISFEQSPTPGVLQKRLIEHTADGVSRGRSVGAAPARAAGIAGASVRELRARAHSGAARGGLRHACDGRHARNRRPLRPQRRRRSVVDPARARCFFRRTSPTTPRPSWRRRVEHFFLGRRYRDPFGGVRVVTHDGFDLLVLETRDPLGNVVTAGERRDRHAALVRPRLSCPAARLITDANGNRSAVIFDALGIVVGSAVMGKRGEQRLAGRRARRLRSATSPTRVAAHLSDPLTDPHAIRPRHVAIMYDLFAYLADAGASRNPLRPSSTHWRARRTTRIWHPASTPASSTLLVPGRVRARDSEEDAGRTGYRSFPMGRMTAARWVAHWLDDLQQQGRVGPPRSNRSSPRREAFESNVRVGVSPICLRRPRARRRHGAPESHVGESALQRVDGGELGRNDTALVADPRTDADVGGFFGRLARRRVPRRRGTPNARRGLRTRKSSALPRRPQCMPERRR